MNVAGDEWRRAGLLKTLQEVVNTTGMTRAAAHILEDMHPELVQHRVEELPAIPPADFVTVSQAAMAASTPSPSEVIESPLRRATTLPPLNWAKRAAANKGPHAVELHFV